MARRPREASGRSGRDQGTERPARPRGTATDRALVLLSVRWRSRSELRQRLRSAGFPDPEVEEALEALERAGLIDDARFAREVVRDQAGRRHASDRAIRSALWLRGVDREVADEALAEAGGEEERARALAASRVGRLGALEPEAAYRRLFGLLVRRGHGPAVAREAAREAVSRQFGPHSVPETSADA